MASLRASLEQTVNGGGVLRSDHPTLIAKLASQFPHSIQHVADVVDRPYNCFMLALGLLESDRVYEILQTDADWYGLCNVKVGPEFVSRLIQRRVLVKDDAGDVVIYFRHGMPVHAGLFSRGRVRSKWG